MSSKSKIALKVIQEVIAFAERSSKAKPVAVAVCGSDGELIAFITMDGVMPISTRLAQDKAYTTAKTLTDTSDWEDKGIDPRNFVDPRITCFAGGVPLYNKDGTVWGAIGVSGRASRKKEKEGLTSPQDKELAEFGSNIFDDFLSGARVL